MRDAPAVHLFICLYLLRDKSFFRRDQLQGEMVQSIQCLAESLAEVVNTLCSVLGCAGRLLWQLGTWHVYFGPASS